MTDTVPTITLAGKEWPVPTLAIKQNRVAVPAFLKFMPAFVRITSSVEASKQEGADPNWFARISLTTEDYDAMSDAIYAALTRGTPDLARNDFDNMPISLKELFSALPVVAQQTGIFQPSTGAPKTGEG